MLLLTLHSSVVTVNYVIADGKSNWLEGVLLMGLYIILAVYVFAFSGAAYNADVK
jgi:Ca2+:H+ antiporter